MLVVLMGVINAPLVRPLNKSNWSNLL